MKYIAIDKTVFDTEEECIEYEDNPTLWQIKEVMNGREYIVQVALTEEATARRL